MQADNFMAEWTHYIIALPQLPFLPLSLSSHPACPPAKLESSPAKANKHTKRVSASFSCSPLVASPSPLGHKDYAGPDNPFFAQCPYRGRGISVQCVRVFFSVKSSWFNEKIKRKKLICIGI